MRFKRRNALFAGLVVAAIGLWLLARLILEPSYHRKSLNAWLEAYDGGPEGCKASPEADAALRAIGPAAVPHLLKLLKATNTFGWPKLVGKNSAQRGAPHAVQPGKPQMRFGIPAIAQTPLARFVGSNTPYHFERLWVPSNQQRWKVFAAFKALGSLGQSAIPDLAKLARNMNNDRPLMLKTNGIMAAFLLIPAQEFLLQMGPGNVIPIAAPTMFPGSGNVGGSLNLGGPSPSTGENYLDGDMAAWCLAAIGGNALQPLLELLSDTDTPLRERAATALGMIGPGAEPAVPALVQSLKDQSPAVRSRAAEALGNIGRQPDLVIPPLVDALSDTDSRVRVCSANSLARFGETATNAVPTLLTNFSSFAGLVRQSAAVALSRISPEITAREIVPALLQDLQDSKPFSRNAALDTLAQLHGHQAGMIPAVIAALDDGDDRVQLKAIVLLGSFGPTAKDAVPRLITLTKNRDQQLSQEATAALDKIDPAWRKQGE